MSQIYEAAAETLYLLELKRGSLKQLCFRQARFARPTYALLIKLLPHKGVLDQLIETRWANCEYRELALVMLFDYLTSGKVKSGGRLKREIVTRFADVPRLVLPSPPDTDWRWVRVNPFLGTVAEVKEMLDGKEDDLIPGLIWARSELVEKCKGEGKFVMQDKASAMTVAALDLKPGTWSAFDACSAPGNKTLHLAGLMHSLTSGTLYAFEKDRARFGVLSSRLQTHHASNTLPLLHDFLTVKHVGKGVRYAVVDPSCSGSGIVEHHLVDQGKFVYKESDESDRVKALAGFQKRVLKHALMLGDLEEVVYSTCSLYTQENEEVVRDVLQGLRSFYRLRTALPKWKRRGVHIPGFDGRKCCRTHPGEDGLTGFFVAAIKRKAHRLRHRLVMRRNRTFTFYRQSYLDHLS